MKHWPYILIFIVGVAAVVVLLMDVRPHPIDAALSDGASSWNVYEVTLKDGTRCAVALHGGLDCDWKHN